MTGPTTGRLRVDGTTLHYEVRGSGPLLLLIPGGARVAAAATAAGRRAPGSALEIYINY